MGFFKSFSSSVTRPRRVPTNLQFSTMSKESEKKIMAEKVAKVREVVNGVNNNDIIMVLHSFDLNVEKTIQAFCDGGASGILDDWVRPGAPAGNKNKNKKKKAKSSAPALQAVSISVPSTATVSQNTAIASSAPPRVDELNAANALPKSNNISTVKAHANNGTSRDTGSDFGELSEAFKFIRTAIGQREKELQSVYKNSPNAKILFDTTDLIRAISTFGKSVTERKPVVNNDVVSKTVSPTPAPVAPMKHATSQSSISSSVGADSGVNLSPTHKEDKKAKPQTIVTGGIQMSSEGLSPEQLAALQQSLQLQLAARGLDASVLTSSDSVVRRSRNKQEGKKGAPKEKQNSQPKLSIL
ncbi:unnamed protein product [Caenorhabditis auriculariae]|uniref:Uncharacterized protein n=1 Tax=Caenorhabditis auriculariae TaxID=2777116 RepID=A0A8S1GS88_9PELO|nr:unnamed protein product [Caenorhabditis auriculariae]